MSKGFHRLPSDTPWSNNAINGIVATRADDRRTPPAPARDDAMHPLEDAPLASAHFSPGPPKMTRAQATSAGFTGNSCNECGSMQMVRNGTCEKCNSCGATTGCS